MTTIFLIILFITQVISFYFIALLYMKLSKFNDLEKKQSKLMKEMDDAIAVYLAEVKDENERLIEKLTVQIEEKRQEPRRKEASREEIEEVSENNRPPIQVSVPQQTMRHHARKSYENVQQTVVQTNDAHDEEEIQEDLAVTELDDRARALQLSKAGLSIEEIAKELDKGRTEVELILKFN